MRGAREPVLPIARPCAGLALRNVHTVVYYTRMDTKLADVSEVVVKLLRSEDSGITGLAARLGVNPATVSRWKSGEARPRPELEGRLRALAAKRLARTRRPDDQSAALFAGLPSTDSLDRAFGEALHTVREALHRNGRLSSRHEALDELAKLVFAHFASVEGGGAGIAAPRPSVGRGTAESLRLFVEQQIRLHLPTSMSHEFAPDDFGLRLKPTEDRLAQDLIACFATLSPDRVGGVLWGARDADLLNDTFGRFLADSFTDEKELGQYLTPPPGPRALRGGQHLVVHRLAVQVYTRSRRCDGRPTGPLLPRAPRAGIRNPAHLPLQ